MFYLKMTHEGLICSDIFPYDTLGKTHSKMYMNLGANFFIRESWSLKNRGWSKHFGLRLYTQIGKESHIFPSSSCIVYDYGDYLKIFN